MYEEFCKATMSRPDKIMFTVMFQMEVEAGNSVKEATQNLINAFLHPNHDQSSNTIYFVRKSILWAEALGREYRYFVRNT